MIPDYRPLVTVVTLVYNTGKYVIKGIQSLQSQNYPKEKIQHIIIDDCSKDDSSQIIEDYIQETHHQCIFIKHKENKGINFGLNEALSLSKGDYYMGLSDDISLKDRLIIQTNILEHDKPLALTCCDMYHVDERDNQISDSYFTEINIKKNDFNNIFKSLLFGNFIPAPGIMYRTSSLRDVGGFDESLSYEDWDIHLRLSQKFPIHLDFDNKLVKYRSVSTGFVMSRSRGDVDKLLSDFYILKKCLRVKKEYDDIVVDNMVSVITHKIYPHSLSKAKELYEQIRDINQNNDSARLKLIEIGIPFMFYRVLRKLKLVK